LDEGQDLNRSLTVTVSQTIAFRQLPDHHMPYFKFHAKAPSPGTEGSLLAYTLDTTTMSFPAYLFLEPTLYLLQINLLYSSEEN